MPSRDCQLSEMLPPPEDVTWKPATSGGAGGGVGSGVGVVVVAIGVDVAIGGVVVAMGVLVAIGVVVAIRCRRRRDDGRACSYRR